MAVRSPQSHTDPHLLPVIEHIMFTRPSWAAPFDLLTSRCIASSLHMHQRAVLERGAHSGSRPWTRARLLWGKRKCGNAEHLHRMGEHDVRAASSQPREWITITRALGFFQTHIHTCERRAPERERATGCSARPQAAAQPARYTDAPPSHTLTHLSQITV